MFERVLFRPMFTAASLIILSLCTVGCTPAEEQSITSLESAMNSLVENRTLTEQFVRDVKASANPSDPNYAQVMESYQDARESYNHYLDVAEGDDRTPATRTLRTSGPLDVRNATADFLADATNLINPSLNTRRIPFQRAVVIPENLQASLQHMSKKNRTKLVDQFDKQVRWRSWTQL